MAMLLMCSQDVRGAVGFRQKVSPDFVPSNSKQDVMATLALPTIQRVRKESSVTGFYAGYFAAQARLAQDGLAGYLRPMDSERLAALLQNQVSKGDLVGRDLSTKSGKGGDKRRGRRGGGNKKGGNKKGGKAKGRKNDKGGKGGKGGNADKSGKGGNSGKGARGGGGGSGGGGGGDGVPSPPPLPPAEKPGLWGKLGGFLNSGPLANIQPLLR